MKKLICVFLATITLLCFTACEKKEDKPADGTDSDSQVVSVESTETLKEKTVSEKVINYGYTLGDIYLL